MPSISGIFSKFSLSNAGNNDRRGRKNPSALAGASAAMSRENNSRGDREKGRTSGRGRTLDQAPDEAALEREELRRFQQSVWDRVKDVDMMQLRPDCEERKHLTYVIGISFRLLYERVNELAEILEDRQKQLGTERAEHQAKLDSLRKEHDHRHTQGLAQERKNYEGQLFRIQNFHESNAKDMEKRHRESLADKNRDISELNSLHGAAIRDLEDQLNRTKLNVEAVTRDRDDQLEALRYDHATKIQDLEQESSDRAAEHERLVETVQKKHDVELSNMKSFYQDELTKMTAQHATDTRGLREQVQSLNNVLLEGDDSPLIASILSEAEIKKDADEKISAKFSEVVGLVDELSRLPWKSDQQVWTNQILRKIGAEQNLRLLKKSILQDSIWSMLHLYIFCSPFRVFGNEGKTLEKDWNTYFDKDPRFDNGVCTWPAMNIEAERWRYMTITGCRKALMKPPISRHDVRVKLRDEFMKNKADLLLELNSMLDGMVKYTPVDTKRIDHLVNVIANVWLEFGMHRCRFILFMAGSNPMSITEKARQAEEGNLELTVVPGLRRHGNVEGIDLTRSTIVGRFEGSFVRLSGENSIIDSE